MPRQARLDAPGAVQHIIIRGIERRLIFRDDTDRNGFIDRLAEQLTRSSTRCYAWALLPNHAHFLLRTGKTPLATVMRRLLTGYAVTFNLRHRRHGHLFQNRYRSILCQEDPYLLELVRYIHLNPVRAGMVNGLRGLNHYPYSGHSSLMGKREAPGQDTEYVLRQFGDSAESARRRYLSWVKEGLRKGRRPELVGGGLIRSLGGWAAARAALRGAPRIMADERILGDSSFVEEALAASQEHLDRRFALRAKGYDFGAAAKKAAATFGLSPAALSGNSKNRTVVRARSLLCYWAVRELGMTATEVARRLGVTQPAVSASVNRGEEIARAMGARLAGS